MRVHYAASLLIVHFLSSNINVIAASKFGDLQLLQPRIICPNYVYAHRRALNTTITCVINSRILPERIRWYATVLPSSHGEAFSLGPDESFQHYSFSFRVLNGTAVEATLSFDYLNSPSDYRTYSLSAIVPGSGLVLAGVHLYERGQGKAAFEWWDILIFVMILVISAGIGVYYGFIAKQKNTQDDYMLGGRQMGWVPVSLSLIASFMSAITLLGTPSEIYTFGTQYLLIAIAYPFVVAMSSEIFLPIFYKLRLTSAYEYLELRFSKPVRVAGAIIFVLQMVIYMSMVIYMPSLALEAVIGMNFWFSALTTAVVCIFYTSMGGMKATMWTDAFQVVMMYIGLLAIFIQGCIREGGFSVVWERAQAAGRIQFFEMNPDPRIRHSFWTMTVGGTFTWLYTYGVNQAQVQRGLSAKTLTQAKVSYWINVPALIVLMLIPALCGLLIYSRYQQCDPVRAGIITKRDQLLVYYVMDIVSEDLPGIPGLFMATLFSAALSTISSGINGLAAVTCRDFGVDEWLRTKKGLSEEKITWIAKLISALYGGLCILLIFPIQYLPGLLDSALGLFGALGGPLLGIYMCGVFFPWMKGKAALVGLIASVIVTMWMTLGEKTSPDIITAQRMPSVSTMSCDWESIVSTSPSSSNNQEEVDLLKQAASKAKFIPERPINIGKLNGLENLYSISYLYLGIVGIGVSFIVGTLTSFITGWNDLESFDERLIHPWVIRATAYFQRRSVKISPVDAEIKVAPDDDDNSINSNNNEKVLPEKVKNHDVEAITAVSESHF